MNALDLIYRSIYQQPLSFARIEDFIGFVETHVLGDGGVDALLSDVDSFIEAAQEVRPLTAESAARALVAMDLTIARPVLERVSSEPEATVVDVDPWVDRYISSLEVLGLVLDDRPYIGVVDDFPAPFEGMQAAAFCPDVSDEKRYGIRRGIYLKRERVRPLYTELLLAHEFIHLYPGGGPDAKLLAMGLEEGLADLFGTVYLGAKHFGVAASGAALAYGRHGVGRPIKWSLYLDHLRQALRFSDKYGVGAAAGLLVEGRASIHEVEREFFSGMPRSRGPVTTDVRFEWPADVDRMLDATVRAAALQYVLSPLEWHMTMFADEGSTATDIASELGVETSLASATLDEVARRTTLFVFSDDRVEYSNVGLYRDAPRAPYCPPVLRYALS